jgi:hypothetical protein
MAVVSVVVVVAQVSEPVKMSSRGSTYWLLAFWLFFLSASWFHCVAATHTGHHGKVRARRPAVPECLRHWYGSSKGDNFDEEPAIEEHDSEDDEELEIVI